MSHGGKQFAQLVELHCESSPVLWWKAFYFIRPVKTTSQKNGKGGHRERREGHACSGDKSTKQY